MAQATFDIRKVICKVMEIVGQAHPRNQDWGWLAVQAGGNFSDEHILPWSVPSWWQNWRALSQGHEVRRPALNMGEKDPVGNLLHCMKGRKLAITEGGDLGWVPRAAERGDMIAILQGSKLPFILRRGVYDGCWRLVGPCFIQGIMFGEAWVGYEATVQDIILE
jgi:hypothetical protein